MTKRWINCCNKNVTMEMIGKVVKILIKRGKTKKNEPFLYTFTNFVA